MAGLKSLALYSLVSLYGIKYLYPSVTVLLKEATIAPESKAWSRSLKSKSVKLAFVMAVKNSALLSLINILYVTSSS